MRTDGQVLLRELAEYPANTFENHFAKTSRRLGLGVALDREELLMLYTAAFHATLCNIAFNGLGGCEGEISPEREPVRVVLEREFMAAQALFFRSRGWNALPASVRGQVRRAFLRVAVADRNLAG
jgi:hypothetical protein